MEQISKLNSLN